MQAVGSIKAQNDKMVDSRNKLMNMQPFKTELRGMQKPMSIYKTQVQS